MSGYTVAVLIVSAVLGSKVLDTMVERFFRKNNDEAEAVKTGAESTQIYAKAAETTLHIMQTTIQSQDERIRAQDSRIQRLEEQVMRLHTELMDYRRVHGPLTTGEVVHFGDVTGTIT